MARIAGVDLPRNKRMEIALTYIFGLGRSSARKILESAGVDYSVKTDDVSEEELQKIRGVIDEQYKVEGDLTIKKTTKPIKFIANIKEDGSIIVATADIQIDRSEYDVRYGSGSFFDNLGDKTIYDEFDLSVELVVGK